MCQNSKERSAGQMCIRDSNLVWDKLFGLGIFDEDIFEQELDYYLTCFNRYGLPLDCRKDYPKNDWLMWSTMLADHTLYTEKDVYKRQLLCRSHRHSGSQIM